MSEDLVRDMNTHVRTRICNLLDVEREDGKDARLFGEKIGIEKPNINVAWFGRGKSSTQPTGTFLTFWEKFNPTVKRLKEIMFEMERYDVVDVLEKEYTYLIPGTAVNCYPRDFYYHPRRTIDEHISKIEKGRLHIVHGPIGTGKYSAAMQYIENSERKFSVKWRIDCSQDDESIHEELTTDLAEKLRLKSGCPLDHLFEAIKGRARKENVIFLLENLEPKNHQGDWLKKLWRVKGCVYIIATSSNSNLNAVFSGAQMVNVSDFNEAVGFLKENKQIEKDNSDDDLNELCKYYGWNALGITNAKKYIGLTGMCAKKYLKMIRNKTANLKRRTKKSEDQQIYLSVRMVLEEVDNEKFRVIAAISLIGYENIPDFLLSDLFPSSIAEERTSDLNDLVTDSPFLKLLKPIRKENNIRLLSCQTYTQTVIKELLDRDRELRNQLIHKMAKILMRYFNKDNRHYIGGFFQRILLNHAEIFLKHCQNIKDECTLIAIARLLDVVSFAYTQSRQPEIVLRNHCERAENIIHQICGIVPDDFQAKSIKPDLGVLNLGIRCNDSDVAQQLFQKLSIKSSQLPGTVIKELAFLRPISSNDMELFPPEVRNDEDLKETVDLSEPLSPHNLDILVSNRVAYSVKDYAALFLPELYASLLYSFGRNYFYLNKQSICDVQFYITRLKLAYCISKEISKCMKVGEAVMHEYLAECNALLYLLVNKEDVNSEELKPKEKSVHCQDLQNAIKCYKDLSVSNKMFFEMGILKKKGDDTYSWLVCQQQIVSCYLKLMSLTSGDERNGYIITCSEYCGVLQNRLVHDANSVRYSPKYFNIVGEFYLSTEDDQFLLPAWRVFYISAHDAVEKNLHGPFYAKAVVGMANVLSRLGKQFFIAAKLSSRMLSRLLVENLDEDPPFAKQFQEIGDRNKASFVNHLAVLWRKKAQNKDDQNTDQNVLDTTAHLSSCQISDPMTACNSNTSQGFEKNTSTYQSTTDRMLFIAERIPRDWKTIARYLGLPDYKIDALSFLSVFAGACFVIWFLRLAIKFRNSSSFKMPEGPDVFSNPYAPSTARRDSVSMDDDGPALTNDDFRKLLMTPKAAAPSVAPPSASSTKLKPQSKLYEESDNPAALRRKKKSHYAKLKKLEEEREKELAEKYRDRARERRDGHNPDYQGTDINLKASADYKAVGPTAEATNTAAEIRRRAIQESKFLGGDMEHTHLVKGLDFALLQKVRSEITAQDYPEEDVIKKGKHKTKGEKAKREDESDECDEDEQMDFSTLLGQKVYRTIFKSRPPDKNELFQPGRMAYVFELEDEYAESDIPTTLMRSKADCPGMEAQTTLTTNDIVINKLTQILSYLRQGMRGKRMKRKDKGKTKGLDDVSEQRHGGRIPADAGNIYDELGDYNPGLNSGEPRIKKLKSHDDYKRDKHGYFEKNSNYKEHEDASRKQISAKDFATNVTKQFSDKVLPSEEKEKRKSSKNPKSKGQQEDHYMECYPGGMDADYNYESEEEVDYSKMDMGNKKGPIKRWDFETDEEYNKYMEHREALPKAAFQFGIKMNEGRKTRRTGPKDEKAKLDRDWNRINQIISKRKSSDGDHERSKDKHESKSKKPKMY